MNIFLIASLPSMQLALLHTFSKYVLNFEFYSLTLFFINAFQSIQLLVLFNYPFKLNLRQTAMVSPFYISNIISLLWCIQLSVRPSRHALFILENENFLIWSENKHNRLLQENRLTLRWPFKSTKQLMVDFGH